MTAQKQAQELATKLGAILTEPEYFEYDQSYTTEAEAPDGKQWITSQSLCLVCRWYTYVKGDKEAQYKDLIIRMSDGLEDLDETINPQ